MTEPTDIVVPPIDVNASDLQRAVGEWGVDTLGHRLTVEQLAAIAAKALEEASELDAELAQLRDAGHTRIPQTARARIQDECADLTIVAMSMAHLLGFDLLRAAFAKHVVNATQREWYRGDDGRMHHIPKGQGTE